MKKITLLIAFLMTIVTGSYGQSASTYAFSSSSGTYTNNSAAATLLATVRADTFISGVQPIGFTFVYEGANFTQFKMSSNGFISLGAGTSALTGNDFSTANATSRPIIAPLWDDLDGASPASSVACYELTGVAPNRVLTVEWRNWEWNWNSATPVISFQAKLYETTNVIEFVYRQEATAIAAGSASIGIGSATGSGSGSYLNLTSIAAPAVSSTVSTTNIATKPATGQVYTFTPPTPCTGTPNGGTVSPTSFVLNTGQLPGTIVASGFTSGVTGLTFQWEESTDGFVTPVNAVGGTGATTASYTPPAYNGTPKEYRLKVTCSANPGSPGYSSTSSLVSCAPVSVFPWTEDFDSLATVGTTIFPSCWTKENGDWTTTNNANSTTDADARSGTQFLRDSWSATNEYVWTKGFQLTAGTSYDFSFYWAGDTFSGWTGDVFYNTTPNSVGATQLGSSFVAPGTTTTFSYAKSLNTFVPSSSGVYYFAIRVNQPSSTPNYLSFDDFRFEPSPACPAPLSLTANNFTANSADLNWTPGASEGLWNIQYGPTGFVLGTGTIINGEINPTYTAIGLSGNTVYQYYVQADCGAGSTSVWAGPFSFTTYCDAVIDFTQNFDAVTAPAFPSCWNKVGATGTANTQTANNSSAPNALFLNSSSAANKVVLRTVPVSNLGDGTHWLRFKMRASGTVGGIVEIGYVSDPADANSFVSLGSVTASTLTYQDYNFTPPAGSYSNYLALRHTGAPANGVLIDDVIWEVVPSCFPPTALLAGNFTANSADLNWTPGGSEGAWNVQYGPTGFVLGTGTIITGEINPTYTAIGLLANTTYQYYVQADCGGSTSTWAGPISFTTACDATNVPYVQNFESVTTPAIPACTSVVNDGTGNLWRTTSNPGYGFTTKVLNYLYNSTNAANTWFFTQAINMTGGVSYRISYNYGNDATFYTEKLKVAYGTSASGAGMTDVIADHPTINQQAIQSNVVDFTPATTGVYYIGFQAYSAADQDNLYVDNISVDLTPACSNPIGLAVSNLTDVGANITWTATSGNYQYVLDNVATDPAGAGTTLAGEAYSAGPLSPTTLYYFHVRTDCGGLFSTWSTISFTTLMSPPVNNDLCNATALTVGNISAGNAYTNVGSTGQTSEPAPACFNSGINGSVWFSFVSPASGNVQVTTDIAGGTLTDTEIAVYSGTGITCGDLTTLAAALGCSQDDGVGVDFNSTLNLTGLVSGGTYYVQVDRWGTATNGTFGINVTDSGLSTPSFDATSFKAYPNPVKDILNLSYTKEISSVSVFNLLGQEVLTKSIHATQSQINLSSLSGGTYLVKVTVDGLVKTIKVVKE